MVASSGACPVGWASRWSLDLGVKGDPVAVRDVDGMVFPALGGLHVPELPAPGGGCPVVLEDPLVLGDTPYTFPVIARAAREGLVPHPELQGLAKVDRPPVVVDKDVSSRRSCRCKRDCPGQDDRACDLGYRLPHLVSQVSSSAGSRPPQYCPSTKVVPQGPKLARTDPKPRSPQPLSFLNG